MRFYYALLLCASIMRFYYALLLCASIMRFYVLGYTTPTRRICTHISSATVVTPRRSRGVCITTVAEDIRGAYPPSRCGISDLYHVTAALYKGPPPSNDSLHDAYCKKSKTMPDFVAVKELVDQQVDSYRCSGAALVQALCIRRL